MVRACFLAALMVLGLVACAGEPVTLTETTPPTPRDAAPTPTEEAQSVICDAFADGGPVEKTTEAVIAGMRGENPAMLTREAIQGYEEIAERASGQERDDLLTLAGAMNRAAMSGEGTSGWNAASEAFYVKYAEQCGAELATD